MSFRSVTSEETDFLFSLTPLRQRKAVVSKKIIYLFIKYILILLTLNDM